MMQMNAINRYNNAAFGSMMANQNHLNMINGLQYDTFTPATNNSSIFAVDTFTPSYIGVIAAADRNFSLQNAYNNTIMKIAEAQLKAKQK